MFLFLHPDWALVQDSPDLENRPTQSSSPTRVVVIPLSTSHLGFRRIIVSLFVPLATILYAIASIANNAVLLSRWRVQYQRDANPCFFESQSSSSSKSGPLTYVGSSAAVITLVLGTVMLWRLGLMFGYFRFVLWWGRRCWGVLGWSLASGSLMLVEGASSSVAGAVLTLLIVPILAGLDLLLILAGDEDVASRGAKRRTVLLFRVFFIANLIAVLLSYVSSVAARNTCAVVNAQGSIRSLIFESALAVSRAGYLLALLRVLVTKVRRVRAPALRYGLRCHTHDLSPAPGAPAVLILNPGDIVVAGAEQTPPVAPEQPPVPFTYPQQSFALNMSVWAVFTAGWVVSGVTEIIFYTDLLRLDLDKRCWVTSEVPSHLLMLTTANSVYALITIAGFLVIIIRHGLRGLVARFLVFWLRRNWAFWLLCLARGPNDFRGDHINVSSSLLTLMKYSFLLPVALVTSDLAVLLRPGALFLHLYRLFIIGQVIVQVTDYVRGVALEHPCQKISLSSETSQARAFFLSKVLNTLLLLFAIRYMSLMSIKIFSGLTIPMVRLSDRQCFTVHRANRLNKL
jgi:hypothetical protein